MKKFMTLMLAMGFALALVSCGGSASRESTEEEVMETTAEEVPMETTEEVAEEMEMETKSDSTAVKEVVEEEVTD